jgi:hypothetical protein
VAGQFGSLSGIGQCHEAHGCHASYQRRLRAVSVINRGDIVEASARIGAVADDEVTEEIADAQVVYTGLQGTVRERG